MPCLGEEFHCEGHLYDCGVAVYRFGPCTLNAMTVGSTPINATKFCTFNSAARVPLSHGGSRRFESCKVHQVTRMGSGCTRDAVRNSKIADAIEEQPT